MTIPLLLEIQHDNPNYIFLLPQGSFYHVYNEGATLLSAATNYKLRIGSVINPVAEIAVSRYSETRSHPSASRLTFSFCGFPISALDKVLTILVKYFQPHPVSVEKFDTTTVIIIT